jgi:hypothetical protein
MNNPAGNTSWGYRTIIASFTFRNGGIISSTRPEDDLIAFRSPLTKVPLAAFAMDTEGLAILSWPDGVFRERFM